MKIVGNGFIAKNLKKISIPNNFCVYAAGVSNSNLSNVKNFKREINEFNKFRKKINSKKIVIYVSSLSVENKNLKNDKYVKNKLNIENLIKKNIKKFLIVRLPQVVGKNKNKYTLTNSIFNTLTKNQNFFLWEGSMRNLVDIDDVTNIIGNYLNNKPKINTTINIFNPKSIAVIDLLKIFASILNKKFQFTSLKRKNKNINLNKINKKTLLHKKYYRNLIRKNYIKKVLEKYYK